MTDVNNSKGEFSVGRNPILGLDYPDPDVIFHDGAFYMVSTTMHYMPGCEILRSYDLINWEHFTYVYHEWESTPARRLEGDGHIYGKGMWAATLRYHDGTFYIVFVANDTDTPLSEIMADNSPYFEPPTPFGDEENPDDYVFFGISAPQ